MKTKKTPEQKLVQFIELTKKEQKAKKEMENVVIEIPINFLKEKGFVFGDITTKNNTQSVNFEFNEWEGNIETIPYWNRIIVTYHLKGYSKFSEWMGNEWFYLKRPFDDFYTRHLKKHFEPKMKK